MVKSHSYTGALLEMHIYLAVLVKTDVRPRPTAFADRSSHNDALTIAAPFRDFKVMVTFQRVH